MSTVTVEEAQAKLPELIKALAPGEELVIVQDEQPVARLIAGRQIVRQARRPGSARGKLVVVSEDDTHLQDFHEFMP